MLIKAQNHICVMDGWYTSLERHGSVTKYGIGVKQNSIGFLEFTARMPSVYVYTVIKSSKIFVKYFAWYFTNCIISLKKTTQTESKNANP